MRNVVAQLFEDYLARFRSGEQPDVREYLDRAGPDREELSQLIGGFLRWAEPPEPDEDAVALAQAWIEGEAPLVALRVRRGLKREDVVDALVARFGLAGLREKVGRRYHELETGLLDAGRADPALLGELAALLGTRVAELVSWKPRPLAAQAAYYRADAPMATMAGVSPAAPAEPDEVDRLFGVGT